MKNLTFEEALPLMKRGHKVRRDRWTSGEVSVEIVGSGSYKNAKVTQQMYILTTSGMYSSFLPTVCDILADDWRVVSENVQFV